VCTSKLGHTSSKGEEALRIFFFFFFFFECVQNTDKALGASDRQV
jgi:hypothetical protein